VGKAEPFHKFRPIKRASVWVSTSGRNGKKSEREAGRTEGKVTAWVEGIVQGAQGGGGGNRPERLKVRNKAGGKTERGKGRNTTVGPVAFISKMQREGRGESTRVGRGGGKGGGAPALSGGSFKRRNRKTHMKKGRGLKNKEVRGLEYTSDKNRAGAKTNKTRGRKKDL